MEELKGFKKIRLKPGETKTVTFDLPINSLGFHNSRMRYVVEPGTFHLWVSGDSQSGLESEFQVTR